MPCVVGRLETLLANKPLLEGFLCFLCILISFNIATSDNALLRALIQICLLCSKEFCPKAFGDLKSWSYRGHMQSTVCLEFFLPDACMAHFFPSFRILLKRPLNVI